MGEWVGGRVRGCPLVSPVVTITPQCLLGDGITLAPAATALFGSAAAAVTSGGADAAPAPCSSSASTTEAMVADDTPEGGVGVGVLPEHASEVAEPANHRQQGAKGRAKKNRRRRKAKAKTGSGGGMPE